ncbi:MAG: MBL fold metallo-hydrolase [Solirubrobacteraceae bacterium]|nr:MBL fold metallo-hydrolase [Solirubrobacteraceae bacterium]
MSMRVISQRNDEYRSNSYLVIDTETGHAGFIDCGDPVDHLLAVIASEGLTLERVLLTHHHGDHITGLGHILEAYPGTPVHAHPAESNEMMGVSQTIEPGDLTGIGNIEIVALGSPGHTAGMLNFLVREPGDGRPGEIFTGDTLFKGSVGGVRGPGHTTFADLRHSVTDVILALPHDTVIQPGHEEPTTVGAELHDNPFPRLWRGDLAEGTDPVVVDIPGDEDGGRLATLVLWATDYDSGHKAQVRYADGTDDLVPGSWIRPA